ncbi:MAG TPA: thiamine phosphate synthase [Roseiflexaceae bacterium]|nr:thiamine phosphate synthase [Roseiflexaceae bacterium]
MPNERQHGALAADWSLCVVTDRAAARSRSILEVVRAAIQGGATIIQLREKAASAREMVALGRALLEITRPAAIPLIVNDRLDVALAIGAEGVHLGQDDLPAADARRLLGPDRLLGLSVTTPAEAREAAAAGADYLGANDVFGTRSKPDAIAPIGLEGLTAVARAVDLPVLAIGGVTVQNAPAALAAGAAGLAVISAVVSAADPDGAARALRLLVDAHRRPPARSGS